MWLDPVCSKVLLACTWLSLYVCSLGHQYRIAERCLEAMGSGIDLWLSAGRRLFVAGFAANAISLVVEHAALIQDGHIEHGIEESLAVGAACVLAA
eukprot:3327064-Rhodomonas_salina.2